MSDFRYWGWGGEDDDLRNRVLQQRFQIYRLDPKIGHFNVLNHPKNQNKSEDRLKLLKKTRLAQKMDGLNSLDYRIVERIQYKMFTHYLVDLNFRFPSEGLKKLEELYPTRERRIQSIANDQRRLGMQQKFANLTRNSKNNLHV